MTAEQAPDQEAIAQRMSKHDDLPFPAGSLVPRPCNGQPGPRWRTATKSAAFARKILMDVWQSREDADTVVNSFTTLLAHSAIGWATRHEDLLNPHVQVGGERVAVHPAGTVLKALLRLAGCAYTDGRADEVETEWVRRMQDRLRAARLKNDAVGNIAYAAPAYRCVCGGEPGEDQTSTRPPDVLTDGREAVAKLLEHPGSEWWLLARIFRKLLYGHLGVLPDANRMGNVIEDLPYERAAAATLVARLSAGEAGMSAPDAEVAGGLVAGLSWPIPDNLTRILKGLPDPVADLVPDAEDVVLAGALGLQGPESQWGAFSGTVLPAVQRLARDVAADLSNPALAPRVGLRGSDFVSLKERYERQKKQLGRHSRQLQGSPSIDSASRLLLLALRVSHLRDALLMRMSTLYSYTRWMDEGRGLEFAIRHAEPAQPVGLAAGRRAGGAR
jgi:hypothetical protein